MTIRVNILNLLRKATLLCLMACLVSASFAAFSSGKNNARNPHDSFLARKKQAGFSLSSGYQYRGDRVISGMQNKNYDNLNSITHYQMSNTTYTLNLKKKAFDGRVTFNPNASTR